MLTYSNQTEAQCAIVFMPCCFVCFVLKQIDKQWYSLCDTSAEYMQKFVKTYFNVMEEWFPISLFVSLAYVHQVYLASGNENPNNCFIVKSKVLKWKKKKMRGNLIVGQYMFAHLCMLIQMFNRWRYTHIGYVST